ncbi:MAG: hypothetical protein GSR79_09970 [Desulfurococcales archaeon]|nr:hypothetical protein [Desulfurococcales archaeon]
MVHKKFKISLPFITIKQEGKTFYCEDHLIKFLIGTPKVYSLIYSRDLGFTQYPSRGFKILKPVFDADKLVRMLRESLTSLLGEKHRTQPVKSMSVKDTLRYILTFIIGLGYANKPPRIKVSRKDVELSNAFYYVKNVLKLDHRKPISVMGYLWLNLEITENDDHSLSFLIIQENREPIPYRVLELLASNDSALRNYILELGSE